MSNWTVINYSNIFFFNRNASIILTVRLRSPYMVYISRKPGVLLKNSPALNNEVNNCSFLRNMVSKQPFLIFAYLAEMSDPTSLSWT